MLLMFLLVMAVSVLYLPRENPDQITDPDQDLKLIRVVNRTRLKSSFESDGSAMQKCLKIYSISC